MIKGVYKKQHQNTSDNSIAIQVGGDLIISYINHNESYENNEKTKIINLIKGESKHEKTNIVRSMLKEDDFINYIEELKNKKEIEPTPKNKGYFDFEWIFIESREFFFSEFNEKVKCDDFYISKKPITKGQFQDFINDGGYKNERWWEDMQKPRNLDLFDKRFSPSYPKVNLSWYECIAYCRWLSEKIKMNVALPNEKQWERATRGGNGKLFPWGDDKKSLSEIDSLEKDGCCKIFNGVFEWCLNDYHNPGSLKVNYSKEPKTLKGYLLLDNNGTLNLTSRVMKFPYIKEKETGFRVVLT